jgi:hypothetical protein
MEAIYHGGEEGAEGRGFKAPFHSFMFLAICCSPWCPFVVKNLPVFSLVR